MSGTAKHKLGMTTREVSLPENPYLRNRFYQQPSLGKVPAGARTDGVIVFLDGDNRLDKTPAGRIQVSAERD